MALVTKQKINLLKCRDMIDKAIIIYNTDEVV